jgi:NADH-quinone oxidoreductase subunit J
MDAFFFWFFSIGMIVCALAVILNRQPVASALCFAFSIVFMSGLFVLLGAFFLAAIQILVTAGAVMVLFLFIIMLLNPDSALHVPRHWIWAFCSMALALGFIFLVARTLQRDPAGRVQIDNLPSIGAIQQGHSHDPVYGRTGSATDQAREDHWDDTHRIGRLLFTTYVAPFEVTSLLILVATVGVIVLCKQDDPPRPAPHEEIIREAPPLREPAPETAGTR